MVRGGLADAEGRGGRAGGTELRAGVRLPPLCPRVSSSEKMSVSFAATPEPGEDPRVTRAKYFIRDEFLVSGSRPEHFRLRGLNHPVPPLCLSLGLSHPCLAVELAGTRPWLSAPGPHWVGVGGAPEQVRLTGRVCAHRESAPLVEMGATTATLTSPALWTPRTSAACSTTAVTSSSACTCVSTSCSKREPSRDDSLKHNY